MSFKIIRRDLKNIPVLEIIGSFSGESDAYKFVDYVRLLFLAPTKRIAIDFNRTDFIDSFGLEVLIYCYKFLEDEKCDLLLLNLHGYVLEVIENSRLINVFNIFNETEILHGLHTNLLTYKDLHKKIII